MTDLQRNAEEALMSESVKESEFPPVGVPIVESRQYPRLQMSKFLAGDKSYQIVVRAESAVELTKLMESVKPLIEGLEAKIGKKPQYEDVGAAGGAPGRVSLYCDVHKTEMKLNKNGKPYHMDRSRAEGDQFCNSYGYPSEKKKGYR